jgi:glycosyltransferase involved in cell wall biosynthesis
LSWRGSSSAGGAGVVLNMSRVMQAYRSIRPDVVHSFSRLAYLGALLPRRVPKLMSYQREPTPRTVRLAARLAKRGSLRFTGCSQYICDRGRSAGGDWTVVHNFVDTDFFGAAPEGRATGPLLFLSRVESIKGPDLAIDIARRSGRTLVIAGNHAKRGPEFEFWSTKIEPHLGRNGIEYVGEVDDNAKRQLLGEAAALLVPIQWEEPFGIVFAEALACGAPIISCPRGALTEIVRPGVNGFLVRSVQEGCEAVNRISEIDRKSCQQSAVESFSIPAVVTKYEALYRSSLSQ